MQTGSIVTTAVLDLNPTVICVNTAKYFLILQFTCKTRFDGCYSAKLHVSFGWNADALAESAESNGFSCSLGVMTTDEVKFCEYSMTMLKENISMTTMATSCLLKADTAIFVYML